MSGAIENRLDLDGVIMGLLRVICDPSQPPPGMVARDAIHWLTTLREDLASLEHAHRDLNETHELEVKFSRAAEAENAQLREALAAIKRHQEIVAGSSVQGMSVTHKIATDALDGVGAPAGIFLTLEQAREIERAACGGGATDDCYMISACPACTRLKPSAVFTRRTEHEGHAPDCWLAAKIRQAEEGHGTS